MFAATLVQRSTLPPLTRREFARRVFWTCHPACDLCAIAHGEWQGGEFVRRGDFSLAQFIAFVDGLPSELFLRLTKGGPFYG